MNRNYRQLLAKVLNAMYAEKGQQNRVKEILSAYGKESYHREQDRVHLGILKLAWSEPEKLEAFTQLACTDYRDLLCLAEYPLSSRWYGLRKKDPDKYRKLQEKESDEYDLWLTEVLSA
jgi:hypothetical protein